MDILNSLILLYSKLYQNRTVPLDDLQACHSVVGKKNLVSSQILFKGKKGKKKTSLQGGEEIR